MAAKAVIKAALSPADGGATAGPIPLGARIGRVVALDENAAPWVDFSGNTNAPVRALLALPVADAMRLSSEWREARVLIVFSDQDLRRPVITGIVTDSLPAACGPAMEIPERLEFHAAEEVALQCGEAKIVLRRDGKIVVVGREIESRAQQKHRIRGGTVAIN